MTDHLAREATGDIPPVPLLAELTTALEGLIATVQAGGLRGLDPAGLIGFITGFEQIRNRLGQVDHQVVTAVEESSLADQLVAGSTTQVLTRVARISPREASARVHATEAVGVRVSMTGEPRPAKHPELAKVVALGRVPVENTKIAVRCLRRFDRRFFATPAQLHFAEAQLADAAVRFGPDELRKVTAKIEDVLFPDGCLADDQQVTEAREITLTPKADGSWTLDGRLTGLCGAALSTVITSLAAPTPGPDGAPDPRSAGQRRHDGLHTAAMMLLRTNTLPRSGGIPASIIVTIDANDLLTNTGHNTGHNTAHNTGHNTGHGWTADGGRLSVAEIMRLADDAELLPVLLTQTLTGGGLQLNLGRTRRCATETQTKALTARDGGCTFPHCTAPPAWCDRHHIVPWRDGGPTDIDNLTLLCGYHHSYFEQHHWRCTMIDDLPHWTPPRWIDPEQTPLLHERLQRTWSKAAAA